MVQKICKFVSFILFFTACTLTFSVIFFQVEAHAYFTVTYEFEQQFVVSAEHLAALHAEAEIQQPPIGEPEVVIPGEGEEVVPPDDGGEEIVPPGDGEEEITPPGDGGEEITPPDDGGGEEIIPPGDGEVIGNPEIGIVEPPDDGIIGTPVIIPEPNTEEPIDISTDLVLENTDENLLVILGRSLDE